METFSKTHTDLMIAIFPIIKLTTLSNAQINHIFFKNPYIKRKPLCFQSGFLTIACQINRSKQYAFKPAGIA